MLNPFVNGKAAKLPQLFLRCRGRDTGLKAKFLFALEWRWQLIITKAFDNEKNSYFIKTEIRIQEAKNIQAINLSF